MTEDIKGKLLQKEAEYVHTQAPEVLHEIGLLKEEYRQVTEGEGQALFRVKQFELYGVSDQTGKLLAWLSQREDVQNWIGEVVLGDGSVARTS